MTSYSRHEDVLRNQIMDAAIECIGNKGVDKTRIGDISNVLGISRQTIYNYYNSKNQLLEATFLREAVSLAENIRSHISEYENLEDKFTHAFLYAIDQFPNNLILSHVITTGGQYLQEMGISRQTMQAFGEMALTEVFEEQPLLKAQSEEISELLSRNIISFLVMPDQNPRTKPELEAFVRRRLVPGLGINQKAK